MLRFKSLKRRPDVRGDQVEDTLRHGGEAADGEVIAEHDDGDIDAGEQVGEVVVDLAELDVAGLQFLVEGGQLLVGGLQFFLGGLQFLVGALQFLVAGLDFLVGRFEFLVGGLLLLDDGLQRLLAGGQFLRGDWPFPGAPFPAVPSACRAGRGVLRASGAGVGRSRNRTRKDRSLEGVNRKGTTSMATGCDLVVVAQERRLLA